jgi:predicted Zn-dependent protease
MKESSRQKAVGRKNGAGNGVICLLLTAFCFLSFSACATLYNPATGRQETLLSTPVEIALGNVARMQMGLVSLKMGAVKEADFSRVQAIGERIARVSDRQDVRYQFGVIQEKSLNAFTLPGGTIYVHAGLIQKADDDELAAVLGHEMGHAAARHTAKHLQADLGFSLLVGVAGAAAGDPGAIRVAESIYGLISNGYSRQDELEADRLGVSYAFRAGYNPEAMVTFFEKMLHEDPEDDLARATVWQRTHPLTSDRIAQAKKELELLRQQREASGD